MTRRMTSTIVLFVLLTRAALAQEQPQEGPCSTPEYRQLDFWIGEWHVTNQQGEHVGDSQVEGILGGCAIQENWQGKNSWPGKSFNAYNRVKGYWQQFWVSSWGVVTEFRGEARQNKLVFVAETVDREGRAALRRMTLSRVAPNRVNQHAEMSYDGGATWKEEYRFAYTPIGAGP